MAVNRPTLSGPGFVKANGELSPVFINFLMRLSDQVNSTLTDVAEVEATASETQTQVTNLTTVVNNTTNSIAYDPVMAQSLGG